MAGNTLGDLLKAGQLDLLKQASSENKSSEKKSAKVIVAKAKEASISNTDLGKDDVREAYKIFHSYVRSVVQKSELYDTMFDHGEEESFATISELYDNPVCKDIIDYFACRFFDGEFEYLDSIADDCERGNDSTPDEYAVILGHKVPITYREEYDLLSILCATAINLDSRFDDEPIEETVIVYNRTTPVVESVQAKPKVQTQIKNKDPQKHKHTAVQKESTNLVKNNKQFVASEWQQFITNHTTPQPTGEKLAEVLSKQSQKNQSSSDAEVKVEKVNKHQKKTQHVLEQFSKRFHLLGVTDVVVELYRKKSFQAILSLFRNNFWKQYSSQVTLDQTSYRSLWEDAHNFMFEFILGRKRFGSNSVVSFRKRSFSSHIANSGVWGRMAAYGGTNGRIIRINAGHGRR